jgi:hypothetical protein
MYYLYDFTLQFIFGVEVYLILLHFKKLCIRSRRPRRCVETSDDEMSLPAECFLMTTRRYFGTDVLAYITLSVTG